jgi:hypothetical protein
VKTCPYSQRRERVPSSATKFLHTPPFSSLWHNNGTSTTTTLVHLHHQISTRPIGASLAYKSFTPIPIRFEEPNRLCILNQLLHRGRQPSNTHLTQQHYTGKLSASFNQPKQRPPLLLARAQRFWPQQKANSRTT